MPIAHPKQLQQILLRMNHKLMAPEIAKLHEIGVRSIWVRYPSLDFISKFVSREIMDAQSAVLEQISDTFDDLQGHTSAKLSYESYCNSIGELVGQLVSNPQAAIFMGELAGDGGGEGNAEIMRHSSSVTFISLLMGLKLESYMVRQRKHIDPVRAKEVTNMGVGAMLHDLGEMKLDYEVREQYKNSKGDESDPRWREHPSLGFELVRGHIDPSAATVVLNHHQRRDGSGYAGASVPVLDGQRIHVYARIVGLADEFDRLSHRPNSKARLAVDVLRELVSMPAVNRFEPEILRALLMVVPPYPPGSIVKLSDNRWAACIDHRPENPCRPSVQIIPNPKEISPESGEAPGEVIALHETHHELHIAEYDGQNVKDLNFPPPAFVSDTAKGLAWT